MEFYMGKLPTEDWQNYKSLMAEYLHAEETAQDIRKRHGSDSAEYGSAQLNAARIWCQTRPYETKIGKSWMHA